VVAIGLGALSACAPAPHPTDATAADQVKIGVRPPPPSMRIVARKSPVGTYLADQSGRTLYVAGLDGVDAARCVGTCRVLWPAALVTGAVSVQEGAGVARSSVDTIAAIGGARQVTYDGHPLYYYSGDHAPGEIRGNGCTSFGTTWQLLDPSGQVIRGAPPGWRPAQNI